MSFFACVRYENWSGANVRRFSYIKLSFFPSCLDKVTSVKRIVAWIHKHCWAKRMTVCVYADGVTNDQMGALLMVLLMPSNWFYWCPKDGCVRDWQDDSTDDRWFYWYPEDSYAQAKRWIYCCEVNDWHITRR